MNAYLLGGSSISSNKALMAFTGTDPEYSGEVYLNAVIANLILNTGLEPVNTQLHQSWIQRGTALMKKKIKQLAVRIETLVRKAYSLNTHDNKNTKTTETLMMTLTPLLRKIAIKTRAIHPSSNQI